MANRPPLAPAPKKKMGCLAKLIILVVLAVVAYIGYWVYDNKDELEGKSAGEIGNMIADSAVKDFEKSKKFASNKFNEMDKDFLNDLKGWSDSLKKEFEGILNEKPEDVKKDVAKYQKSQSKERKIEVEKEMAAIAKIEKPAKAPKLPEVKGVKTVEDALKLDLKKAKEPDLVKAAHLLSNDFNLRYKMYQKDKKKNKDQLDIAITHARLAKQMYSRIYELNNSNTTALENRRRMINSIRSMMNH